MRQNPKNTVFAFILIGISFIVLGWVFDVVYLENLSIWVSDRTPEAVIKSVRQGRQVSTMLYVVGVVSLLIACVRLMRIPMGSSDSRE